MLLGGIVLAATAFVLCAVLARVAGAIAVRLGHVDRPGPRKIHAAAVPYGGGVAIFLTVNVLAAAALALFGAGLAAWPEALAPWMRALSFRPVAEERHEIAILGVGAGVFLLGWLDDVVSIRPGIKIAVEALLFSALPAAGVTISVLGNQGPGIAGAATVLWLLFACNSFNLLDNHDGVLAAVGAVVAAALALVAGESASPEAPAAQWAVAALMLLLLGALLGFLTRNFPPARLFAGDAGSLYVGYLLGAAAVEVTFVYAGTARVLPVVMPALIFAVPAYDTMSVILIRLRARRSPLAADRSHFAHRLRDLGFTAGETLGVIALLAAVAAVPSLALPHLRPGVQWVLLAQVLLLVALVAMIERAALRAGRARAGETGR
ncbi:MAG: undecaprenyl/decaprenyl-phosphate alpha-N-acetylglucosaminyl 1-phosphate transferase, partial [Planctomycetes bacterium]|nr:undecaprenyl/decaprenyl-phosphate alpha-N-acetylglucosaminyl 1-phosphate transferase [Planctomycetota bacterium]